MIKPLTRWTVRETQNGVQVILPSKKSFFTLAWFALWIAAWGYATAHVVYLWGVMTFGSTLDLLNIPPLDDAAANYALVMGMVCVFPFLVVLLGMGGVVIYSFLWQIAGKEIIEVNKVNLGITREVFKFKKLKEYPLEAVNDLRLISKSADSSGLIKGIQKLLGKDGIISFDYGSKTLRFGLDIDESEANQIIEVIQKRLSHEKAG